MTQYSISLLFTSLILLTNNAMADIISVNISGVQANQGKVLIGIFNNAKEFPEGKPFQKAILLSKGHTIKHSFKLPSGKYAVAVFQDKNNNKKVDKNFIGTPKEKYGFSGKQIFGKPSFQDAEFDIKKNKIISIHLK